MKISNHFDVREFVPPVIFNKYGIKSQWFIAPQIVKLAEFYREWFDAPVHINDWAWGGNLRNRGYRVPNSKIGALYSQHKRGAAFDCHIDGVSADEVRNEILRNKTVFMRAGLTTLEHEAYAPTWVHSDIRHTGYDYILIVKPASVQTVTIETSDEEFNPNDIITN